MKALAPTVWGKKIFKVFSIGCHGNQSSSGNSYLWSILKVHQPKIISVKFHWNLLAGFRGEDFLSNCSRTDGRTHGRTDAGRWSITIAHPEHVVLRWANKKPKFSGAKNARKINAFFYKQKSSETSELQVDEQSESRPSSSDRVIDFIQQCEGRPSASSSSAESQFTSVAEFETWFLSTLYLKIRSRLDK